MQARFSHLQIPVADVGRSVDFYCSRFGGTQLLREGDDWALVRCGNYELALARSDESIQAQRFHFGFGVATKDEAEAWYRRLSGESVRVVRPWSNHGDWADFTVEDPDGYHVQVYWEKRD